MHAELSGDLLYCCLEHVDDLLHGHCKLVSREFARVTRALLNSHSYTSTLPLRLLLSFNAPAHAIASRATTPAGATEALAEDTVTGKLPLHEALEARRPEATCLALLSPAPSAIAQRRSQARQTPLHTAVSSGASSRTITSLLAAYPDGARQVGVGRRLPLHLAVACGASVGVVTSLLEAYREGAQAKTANAKEGLALHLALASGSDAGVVRALLAAHPEAALRHCGSIGLPLHAAASQMDVPAVEALLATAPEAAKHERRADGMLPIHIALRSQATAAAEANGSERTEERSLQTSWMYSKGIGASGNSPMASDGNHGCSYLERCSRVIRALLATHPVTSQWSFEALILARAEGQTALLCKLEVERCGAPVAEAVRQSRMLLARANGAPGWLLQALGGATGLVQQGNEPWHAPTNSWWDVVSARAHAVSASQMLP